MNVKTLSVDWDSEESLSKTCNVLKSRLGEFHAGGKKERYGLVFDACQQIWTIDTSSNYYGLSLDKEPAYYTYVHMDPSARILVSFNPKTAFAATLGMTHIPFYVGKGRGTRTYLLERNETHRKIRQRINANGREVDVFIVRSGLTEREALAYEDKLIDILGLKVYGGFLTNLDEGHSPERRRLLYADQYSLMAPRSHKHKGSTPLPSTTEASSGVSMMGG